MDLMLYKERQMVGHRSSPKTLERCNKKIQRRCVVIRRVLILRVGESLWIIMQSRARCNLLQRQRQSASKTGNMLLFKAGASNMVFPQQRYFPPGNFPPKFYHLRFSTQNFPLSQHQLRSRVMCQLRFAFLIVMYCENDYRVTLWSRMANGNVCDYEDGDKKLLGVGETKT